MTEHKKKIIVGGCPRSGTSLFADFLVHNGLRTVSDPRSSDQYPRGYHEYFPLLMFHNAMERYPRGAMHRITDEEFLTPFLLEDEFTRQVYHQAFSPFRDDNIDFIKYPQLALSMEFIFDKYSQIHLIGLWRNPAAVFRSLVKKEFPIEMWPASGVKAILLQSVYAHHLLKAQQKYPDRVTIYEIDHLINKEIDLGPELKRLGYDVEGTCPLTRNIDADIWTKRVPLLWYLYYISMKILVFILFPFFPDRKKKFSRLGKFNQQILRVCYGSHHSDF